MENKLLVPFDFTPVTEKALAFAVETAKIIDAQIVLLHMVGDSDKKSDALQRLDEVIASKKDVGIPMSAMVNVGDIFDGIGEAASQINAMMVFMGTHGMKGLQYVFGSNAMRVVTKSEPPFVIVQENSKITGIDEIVVPVDIQSEEKQILKFVSAAAKTFHAKVFLIAAHHKDEWLRNSVIRNLQFSKKYLAEQGIQFETKMATGEKDFHQEVVDYGKEVEADLICIINHNKSSMSNLFGNNFDQNMITNQEGIPVMVYNAKDFKRIVDIFAQYFDFG
ncbi:MAG: universal stress protein [Bacteroidota bacterium]|nr:universal stress protein [Bacteroidota bacterium]